MGASDDSPLGTSVCWAVSPLPVPHKDLPSRLWHVQHRHSQSVVNHNGGFTAASGYQSIRDEHDLKLQAIRHFNWDTHLYDETLGWQSCFISAFGDSRHAKKWGKRRVGQVTIYEIDVAKLPSSTVIFDAVKLCGDLAIAHPWAKNEFIFLHEIPGECVGHGFDLIGGQYYWQPKWPITYSPSPYMPFGFPVLGTGSYTPFGSPMLGTVPMGYPTPQFHHLIGPYMPLGFPTLGTWPLTYPASQYCHGSGGLYSQSAPYRPVESANTKDAIDSLIEGFTDALRINNSTHTLRSNTFNIRREG
ncbi:hypothetical protein SMACR_12751 [Sordaria macrospora]|uniref:WGS project CABT00000000 data, contig 2.27 n=2 Tax=Sordaria macrospora TaxID=5147 RepID=F7W484_SORMK|nr:uncharacterized protein SMAC_12751 [Sordaria macrospora k-hell]KAA8628053.1 hypothetical protein SMACR_12751 [Sordaria macrospora]KAH7635400.1 hypothetical protein B0T09DRAFT_22648 [Sordaria sp. MPI-SDFR-AT-0083]WPJ67335.1 hypothetical protein SMAC4_12751 [Sordaria macrospora]CCC14837.1 unnamed protein product [Sordaria macrospora k-hell]